MKDYFKSQLDSLQLEQTMLVGPEFSNNIIKLYNKVNILEDRAFFMDSLYFSLVTDMVIIENQISSLVNSMEEIEFFNSREMFFFKMLYKIYKFGSSNHFGSIFPMKKYPKIISNIY